MADTERGSGRRTVTERFSSALDSWQKIVVAMTALVIAIGGLVAAGVKVANTLTSSPPPVVGPSPPVSSQSSMSQSSQRPSTRSAVPTATPSFIGTSSFAISDENYLSYTTATGQQNAFHYFAGGDFMSGSLVAQSGTNMAVLDPPAPTEGSAYAACEANTAYTSDIELNSLRAGSTLCVFTPDGQVIWMEFHPTDPNSQSNALNVTVFDWQSPAH